MNEPNAQDIDQQTIEIRLPAIDNPPAIASIEQVQRGANDADVEAPAKLKCVDVLALAMLESGAGG
jgi:hypothetical protein